MKNRFHFLALLLALFSFSSSTFSATPEEAAEMQKRLNQETLDKPFRVEDTAKIDTYINDAMKKNLQPKKNPPGDWQQGNTCDSYYRKNYSYNGYRDCLYYQRYYGHYW